MTHSLEGTRVPEPALIRGSIVALTALVAVIFKVNIDISWLDQALTIYGVLAPIIAGVLIRQKVTPSVTAEERVKRALYAEPPRGRVE